MVPKSVFTKKIAPNSLSYCEICYNLVITIKPTTLHFQIEFEGKIYGEAVVPSGIS